MSTRAVAIWVAAAASVLALLPAPAFPQERAFDLDTGNAAHEVVIPAAIPPLLATWASSDASLVLHTTVQINNGWFDGIAPYHPTAVGVASQLGRRPASERATNRQRNIAILYASYRCSPGCSRSSRRSGGRCLAEWAWIRTTLTATRRVRWASAPGLGRRCSPG